MPLSIAGFVKNGLVVPNSPLPEGAQVEIRINDQAGESKGELAQGRQAVPAAPPTPRELRAMPREQRQAILAVAAEMAEEDYRSDEELTGFEAFSEEELDDDEPNSP